jgi:hypothetical protein
MIFEDQASFSVADSLVSAWRILWRPPSISTAIRAGKAIGMHLPGAAEAALGVAQVTSAQPKGGEMPIGLDPIASAGRSSARLRARASYLRLATARPRSLG